MIIISLVNSNTDARIIIYYVDVLDFNIQEVNVHDYCEGSFYG